MGHLINPIAMRLGCFTYWEDYWFVDFVYYAEFLHLIFKVKAFCLFFFSFKFLELGGFLYSHFYILKNFKTLLIRVFFFNGILDECVETYFLNCWKFFFEDESYLRKKGKFFPSPFFISAFRFFIMLKFISYFSFKRLAKNLSIHKILSSFRKFDFHILRKTTYTAWKATSLFAGEKVRFFFLFSIIVKLLSDSNWNKKKGAFQNVEVEYVFIKTLFLDKFFGSIFLYLNKFLSSFIINFISFFCFGFRFDFFILRNEDINAKFLSRFIARKLQQGYKLRHAVNPIKRELRRVISLLRIFNPNKVYKPDIEKASNSVFLKNLYVKLLNFLFSFFKMEFYRFYFSSCSWFRIDLFIYYYYLRNLSFKVQDLVGLSIYFCIFYLFFDNGFFIRNLFINNYNKFKFVFISFYLNNLNDCLKFLVSSINGFDALFFDYFLTFSNNAFLLKSSFSFLNDCLKYNYCLVQKYISFGILKASKVQMYRKNFFGFVGFRLKFKGRFSRRQRASSILYNVGNVPLTTLKANIDYGFYTIPLKNSAVSIKIWLHRNFSFDEIDVFNYKYDYIYF